MTLVCIFMRCYSYFTFSLSLERHTYASALIFFISNFMQRVSLLISRDISANFSYISSILRWVTRLTSAVFYSIFDIFSVILLEGSRHISSKFYFSSASISAACQRLDPLVSSAFSAFLFHFRDLATGINHRRVLLVLRYPRNMVI